VAVTAVARDRGRFKVLRFDLSVRLRMARVYLQYSLNRFLINFVVSMFMVLALSSCSSSTGHLPESGEQPHELVQRSTNEGSHSSVNLSEQSCGAPELVQLWQERESGPIHDLPVGPGDVINVSVPEIEEIQNQKVRVSAQGTISLPLIGTVQVAGMSENELRDAINRRLIKYMKRPRVELFVENYRSRGVAIMGAVQKPGYYDMADESDSVMDMIGLAGGLSPSAAQKLVFSPARVGSASLVAANDVAQVAIGPDGKLATPPLNDASASSPSLQLPPNGSPNDKRSALAEHSIVLNLDLASDEACLGMPARPGDVVVVPIAGQVMVQGWVRSPGAFAVTPGLTMLGAVSAAGGAIFSWNAQLLRGDAHGGKDITEYSLSKLESGVQQDPSVQSGDVIMVQKTVAGAVPYAIYSLFQKFGTGLAFPIP
jgi:polysaccharide export outer membrane protein